MANLINSFLFSVSSLPELSNVSVGKKRLDLLQNLKITTPDGCQYDEFIGHVDEPLLLEKLPEDLFEEGDYDN